MGSRASPTRRFAPSPPSGTHPHLRWPAPAGSRTEWVSAGLWTELHLPLRRRPRRQDLRRLCRLVDLMEDLLDDGWILDESQDPHGAVAPGAEQRQALVDPHQLLRGSRGTRALDHRLAQLRVGGQHPTVAMLVQSRRRDQLRGRSMGGWGPRSLCALQPALTPIPLASHTAPQREVYRAKVTFLISWIAAVFNCTRYTPETTALPVSSTPVQRTSRRPAGSGPATRVLTFSPRRLNTDR